MTGHTNWKDIKASLPAERQAAIAAEAQRLAELPFVELRRARKISQETLAGLLGTGQAAVSKLERRTDMYLSTLRGIIEAMGGHLEIVARFPDGAVKISRFGETGDQPQTAAEKGVPADKVINLIEAIGGQRAAAPTAKRGATRKAAYKRPSGTKKRGAVKAEDVPRLKHR